MFKGSILAYILAATLTVTTVTVGVVVAVKNHNDKVRQEESYLENFETDAQGNYIGPDGNTYSAEEILELGQKGENRKNTNNNSNKNGETEESRETESMTEVATDIAEIEGATIEGVLGVEEIDDSELVIEYSGDDFRYSNANTNASESYSNPVGTEPETPKIETPEPETPDPVEVAKEKEIATYKEINANKQQLQESIAAKRQKDLENIETVTEGDGGGE